MTTNDTNSTNPVNKRISKLDLDYDAAEARGDVWQNPNDTADAPQSQKDARFEAIGSDLKAEQVAGKLEEMTDLDEIAKAEAAIKAAKERAKAEKKAKREAAKAEKEAAKDAREKERANRKRVEEAEKVAREQGFSLDPTWFALGTKLIEAGTEEAKRQRAAFDELPEARDALAQLAAKVKDEGRHDVEFKCSESVMDGTTGLLKVNGDPTPYALDPSAYRQFWENLGYPGTAWLGAIPVDLRADSHNRMMKQESIARRTRVARARIMDGTPEIFAFVSRDYTPFDVDEIAEVIAEHEISRVAKADIVYDGARMLVDLTFHSDIAVEDYVVGEIFKAGARISTADTGRAAMHVAGYVVRARCVNLSTTTGIQKMSRNRHIGDREALQRALDVGLTKANAAIEPFKLAWNKALREDIALPKGVEFEQGLVGIVKALSERTVIQKADIAGIVKRYTQDEVTGQSLTRAGVVNAITSYAHRDVADRWSAAALEAAAGTLTFESRPLQYVHVNVAA